MQYQPNHPGENLTFAALQKACKVFDTPVKILRNAIFNLPNQDFRSIECDFLVITEAGVLLIENKHAKGHIHFDGQVLYVSQPNGFSEKMLHPLAQNKQKLEFLRNTFEDVSFYSIGVFSNPYTTLDQSVGSHLLHVDELTYFFRKFSGDHKYKLKKYLAQPTRHCYRDPLAEFNVEGLYEILKECSNKSPNAFSEHIAQVKVFRTQRQSKSPPPTAMDIALEKLERALVCVQKQGMGIEDLIAKVSEILLVRLAMGVDETVQTRLLSDGSNLSPQKS